jgi:2-C-methyl-D-erythritol 2,4-cyclodiphosphate synthase
MAQFDLRVGLGTDLHRLAPGRRFCLGGVEIEADFGPVAHSDGDVVLHATIDALLGATGLGDIGEWFPDTDPKWKDADSAELLKTVVASLCENGWQVGNLDCVISLERPKLRAYKEDITARLAELLGVGTDAINVKAKTAEGTGPIGAGEAVAAQVVALLIRCGPATTA